MNDKTYQLFTKEATERFLAALETKEVTDLIEQTKAAADSGTFEGLVISTEHEDRGGDIVRQAGMDSTLFEKNPVILNSHNYAGIENITGVATRLYPGTVGGVPATLADGKFAPTEQGQLARKLWDGKFVSAASIGFIAEDFDPANQHIITKWQLLEFSLCPVPMNGYATRLKELGLTLEGLRSKGFVFEEKAAEPPVSGDTCTLDDGTEGVMQDDGNGAITCMPKPKAEEAPAEKGAVSDEISEDNDREAKYAKLDPMFDIINAFIDVYLDEATTPDQFDALLTETLGLLGGLVGSTATTEASLNTGLVKARIGSAKEYVRSATEITTKDGRTLSKQSKAAINKAIDASKACTAALEELLTAADSQGSDGEDQPDGAAPEEGSKTLAESFSASFDNWQKDRQVLRAFVTAGAGVLERLNQEARARVGK